MKKTLPLLLLILCVTSFTHAEEERYQQSPEAVKEATYGHIDAKGLKALIDSNTSFTLLDARGHKWHDSNKISGAVMASYETPQEELETIISDKNSLVIVYCFTFDCPLSRMLAKQLVEFGYTGVIEYPGGLSEWKDVANYSIETIE